MAYRRLFPSLFLRAGSRSSSVAGHGDGFFIRSCSNVASPPPLAQSGIAEVPLSHPKLVSEGETLSIASQRSFSQRKQYATIISTKHSDGSKQGQLRDLEMRVTNFLKEDKGTIVAAGDVFDVPIRKDIVHRVVRWQLAKRRQGTHSTKTKGEVSGSGRKPHPQKGTGRARAGSLRAPQFRHGGVSHGPKPRDYEYKLPKKVRRLGLKIALSARAAEGKLILFDSVEPESQKTKYMAQYIQQIEGCKKVLFVDGADKVNENLCRSTSNLHLLDVLPVKGLNVYSILQHDTLVMSIDAVRKIEQRMHTPINR